MVTLFHDLGVLYDKWDCIELHVVDLVFDFHIEDVGSGVSGEDLGLVNLLVFFYFMKNFFMEIKILLFYSCFREIIDFNH